MSVVALGESLGLLVASRIGRLELVPTMDLGFGGAESNVAIGLARLGVPVTWMGRLGDDALGRLVERQLRAEGVGAAVTRDPEAPTALMLKERPSAGSSAVSYYRAGSAGSRLAPEHLDLDRIRDARVLHVTGITAALGDAPRAALDAAVDAAHEGGTIVSFDVNHRSRLWDAERAVPAYRALAARADVVFAGDDEAELLTGERDTDAQIAALAALGPAQVVVKRGADGATALADGERATQAAFPVHAVDTVGAGDAFVAGYLAELLAGASLAERLRTAAACGALACTAPGDWEAAPDRAAIARLLVGGDPVQR
ncbi:sugar kinase [Agrococcus jenensis]|uniref:2-dehydro-3-deoxygluconokinase n=1 Tax=Agrococcus jenensis TaxID=46353 RepID=A0A3N2AQJ2_9MICO|nr:sugar kinase [Agrococcus jenensis]ROR65266.1 2-dehydro-3-deoxygluconokinase [Agrococcus jenensis]